MQAAAPTQRYPGTLVAGRAQIAPALENRYASLLL
jgi:hypothetical protein